MENYQPIQFYLPFGMAEVISKAPLILLFLVGIILAIIFWKRHRGVSLIALIAFLGLLIHAVASIMVHSALVRNDLFYKQGEILHITLIVLFSLSFLSLVCWGLLLGAIFGWRKKKREAAD
ncbi:hypothetical protein JXJ21_24045 [candidate division KSB1 bacterium]|nr:hypothetical protein [candidate division KSB1 bacterium]